MTRNVVKRKEKGNKSHRVRVSMHTDQGGVWYLTHLSIQFEIGEVRFCRQLVVVVDPVNDTSPHLQQLVYTVIAGNL